MYLLLIVVLLHQTVCSTDFESSESELVVDFESNLDSLNLKSIFDQAESDLAKKDTEQFASGLTSKRFHRKRENALTKEMTQRNKLFRQIRTNLESQGIISESAEMVAKKAIKSHFQDRKRSLLADHCDGDFDYDCDSSLEFRSFDGTCNNLDKPYAGAAGKIPSTRTF